MTPAKLSKTLEQHRLWVVGQGGSRADLSGADLSGADLRSADLSGADLSGADLSGADLSGADLRSADLRSADLSGADLWSANLSGADLSGADLRSADLRSADLSGADLPGGQKLEQYIAELPALLCAGGKTIEDVAVAWNCNSWTNCPMHVAFGANSLSDVPEAYRAQAATFIALFDGGHIPRPSTAERK